MQPFIWMFKVKEFKKHFLYLACFSIALFTLFLETKWIGYLCSIVSGLYLTGYFWNLTEQIIHRDRSIEASNIYDGKIKETYTITLPKLDLIDNVWRGVASIFAAVLLIIPFLVIMYTGFQQGTLADLPPALAVFIPVFLSLFFPALLWNFAYKGSVIAVWNIRKAIYLLGNYPLRYIFNVTILLIICIISGLVDYFLTKFAFSTENIVVITVSYAIIGIKYLYFIFVNAYLIGTIAPTNEA